MVEAERELHVVFGTGPLGMAVMRELVVRGKSVRMINRSGHADVPQGVEVVKGDAYSVAVTTAVAKGAAVAYQCAQPPYHQWPEKFPLLQSAILQGAASNNARLVIGENLYMYGEVDEKIHEDLPYKPTTRKGRTRALMAESALAAHKAGKIRVAIGRGSDFFGPGVLVSSLGERAIGYALKGKTARLLGNLDMPHTYTFIEDFARSLVVLGEREEALGQVWHVPNDRPAITQRELMTLFFREMGVPAEMTGTGRFMLSIAGLFVAGARESVEMMYEFERPFVVDSTKFERTFGMGATPLVDSIRQTIEWYRARAVDHS